MKWGSLGVENGQFDSPWAVCSAGEGIVVADTNNCRVQIFSDRGAFLRKWGAEGTGDGLFRRVYGLTMTDDENLVACDSYNHRIQVFKLDGTFLSKFGGQGTAVGKFVCPFGVACGPRGSLFVSDCNNHRVQKLKIMF